MRESSIIRINRKLVKEYNHFTAMVADCVRHQIEYHLAANYKENPYLRDDGGLYYVNTPGSFICNWLMCDRSTVRKCLKRLIDDGLLLQELFTGKNGGSWLAFDINFIKASSDFFDAKMKKTLIEFYDSHHIDGAVESPFRVVDNLEPGGDNIPGGGDAIPGGGDIITNRPIYNTKAQYQHPKGEGIVDYSFLNESDLRFIGDIHAVFCKYHDQDPVDMVKASLRWKKCTERSERLIRGLYNDFGFDVLAAACVFAFNETELFSPLRYLKTVCERLQSQYAGNLQRRTLSRGNNKPGKDRKAIMH